MYYLRGFIIVVIVRVGQNYPKVLTEKSWKKYIISSIKSKAKKKKKKERTLWLLWIFDVKSTQEIVFFVIEKQ